eukprot:scaffold31241_cov30-Tisochrysis_lutea.AAC.1
MPCVSPYKVQALGPSSSSSSTPLHAALSRAYVRSSAYTSAAMEPPPLMRAMNASRSGRVSAQKRLSTSPRRCPTSSRSTSNGFTLIGRRAASVTAAASLRSATRARWPDVWPPPMTSTRAPRSLALAGAPRDRSSRTSWEEWQIRGMSSAWLPSLGRGPWRRRRALPAPQFRPRIPSESCNADGRPWAAPPVLKRPSHAAQDSSACIANSRPAASVQPPKHAATGSRWGTGASQNASGSDVFRGQRNHSPTALAIRRASRIPARHIGCQARQTGA